nr:MAG TPA: hypothetical protein [Caudoviricetes sp.]
MRTKVQYMQILHILRQINHSDNFTALVVARDLLVI